MINDGAWTEFRDGKEPWTREHFIVLAANTPGGNVRRQR